MSDAVESQPSEIGQPPQPSEFGEPLQPIEFGEPSQPIEIGEPFRLGPQGDDETSTVDGKPRSRVRTIVLGSLVATALAGAGTLGYAGWQVISQKDETLTTPAQIGTLTLNQSDDGKQTADYLQTALSAEVTLDKAVGAVYSDGGSGGVLFFGGTATIWSPEKSLDAAFNLISDKQGAVTGLHKVDPGRFGGTMKCGTTKSDDGELSVCGWADHGSLALAMFPSRSEAASATLLRQIRDATQTRN